MKHIACLTLAAVVGLAGCVHKRIVQPTPGTSNPPRVRTFTFVTDTPNAAGLQSVKDGATAAAKEVGGTKIEWKTPATRDRARQAAFVEGLADARADGIAISCADAAALKPAIDKVVDDGVPVVCCGADSPASKRAAFIGVADRAVGKKLGELLREAIPDGGDVALLTGTMHDPVLNQRIDGFKDAISGSKLRLTTVFPCYGEPGKSVALVRDYIRLHPNIKGWCMVGGWPLRGAVPGPFSETKPGDVKVVAFDAERPDLEYVRQGYVTALVSPKYYEWGHSSVLLLDQLAHWKKVPAFVDIGMDVVTKENVETFAKSRP